MARRKNPPDDFDYTDCEWVSMPRDQFDADLRGACVKSLPNGATIGFNYQNDLAWLIVSQPGDTRQVLEVARQRLSRP